MRKQTQTCYRSVRGVFATPKCHYTRNYATDVQQPAAIVSSEAEVGSARAYCLDLLRFVKKIHSEQCFPHLTLCRKYDTPSFLLQSYMPPKTRDAYLAIRAFNVDIARTADTTSTPTIGSMRLQFQRDAVSKALAGTPPKQPIAVLLAHAADDLQHRTNGKSRFSKSWFHRIISTREQYLTNPPYPDLAALESYAENTYSTLMYLTLQALPMASLTADHVASHIGKATGIATILRGLPLLAFPGPSNHHSNHQGMPGNVGASKQGSVMLPLDVMARHGVREEQVLRQGADAPGLRDAVFEVATRASDHLITAREMLKNLRAGQDAGHDFEHGHEEEHMNYAPSSQSLTPAQEVQRAFPIYMSAVPTALWLERLQKHDFDVFAPKLRVTDWRQPWKTWLAYNRSKF
jgi:NADH dehydrogenase [ubiquinone] 1 alpha subcomplex assembly factor 6